MHDGDFRVRGKEICRLEELSDAVFGFRHHVRDAVQHVANAIHVRSALRHRGWADHVAATPSRGGSRGVRAAVLLTAGAFLATCAKADAPRAPRDSTATRAAVPAASGGSACPATGLWAECSAVYRLERAGLAPHVDSSATPEEKSLHGRPLVLKIGLSARLELFFYPDSAARIADEKTLDRTNLVGPGGEQSINRERLLIESANLVGLFTSLNGHQRERVADALMAGPPQAPTP